MHGSVVVAWDGGRAAARALADAIPLLARAAEVDVLTIIGTERAPPHSNAEPVLQHLARHGVSARARELRAQGSCEDALVQHLASVGCDLLVMGGYGRSPAGELLLGGMTERILQQPPVPVFLSH